MHLRTLKSRSLRRSKPFKFRVQHYNQNHSSRIALLNAGLDVAPGTYTYPADSTIINGRHFYQNTVLLDWAARNAHPVSLRQLAFFGRRLNQDKIIGSGNFVRQELAIRLAHRLRAMQIMPFAVLSNPHLCQVYQQYYSAFDRFRKFPVITSLADNDRFCTVLAQTLDEHLSVIPRLVMGAIETAQLGLADPDKLDVFMGDVLRSRISRRVIAEQHLALSRAFGDPSAKPDQYDKDYIGEVFLQCSAHDTVVACAERARQLLAERYPDHKDMMPRVEVEGNLDTRFPHIQSHLDYIVGELLRNSVEATMEAFLRPGSQFRAPPPIVVSISSSSHSVLIRISDQGAGIPTDVLPHIWSFARGPRSSTRLENLRTVRALSGRHDEVATAQVPGRRESSLGTLASRSPNIKLGLGLPLSRVYAEYWDGELNLQSLEGYGTDVVLRISRLGNQSERLNLDRV